MTARRSLPVRLAAALRGHGSLEDKLLLLGAIGGALFVTLVATLFVVQHRLGRALGDLVEGSLPAEQQIARLEASIGAAFGRQAEVSSTASLAQLEPLRQRAAVEAPLRTAAGSLAGMTGGDALRQNVESFLEADAALLGTVARKHELQGKFEKELAQIDGDLRALVEDSAAVSGHLRLEYVLLLRGIAQSLERGAPRADLVRSAVLGDVRAALDETAELANAVLTLGWVSGKLGLAASSDAINSIVANELPQARARIERVIASLTRRGDGRPEAAARTAALAQRFGDILPRIVDEKREGSLVDLRRRVVAEAATAARIRSEAVAAAARLTADAARLHDGIARGVAAATRSASLTSSSARLVSLIVAALGLAGCAFAARRIRQGMRELEQQNRDLTELKENLEEKVAARTSALVARDRAMQTVLDSMTEGLATVSRDGTVRPERSRAFTEMFGDPGTRPLWEVLYPDAADRAATYACGFEQLCDDIFPFEVAVDQLPRQVERLGRSYELELRAVREGDKLDGVLLVARDVTERLASLRAERAAREEQKVIANLLRDRRGFRRSVDELEHLIQVARVGDDEAVRSRALHTVKGNAAVLGFAGLAERAHALEDELAREGEIAPASFASLEGCFRESLRRVHDLVAHARERIDVDADEYRRLRAQLRARADYDDILALVERWELEPVDNILHELAAHARRLAEQLGKKIDVVVEGNGLRVVDDGLRAFCGSLVHAVRNAIDHGIEAPDVRVARGKAASGTLRLGASVGENGALVVTVVDDGGGVDLERVRERARALGVPSATRSEVLDALFADGLTTRDSVSEVSGRGIGTSAVRAACRELGGEAMLVSEWGVGTELRCILPAAVLGAAAA